MKKFPNLKPLVQGCVGGMVLIVMIGFWGLGWELHSTGTKRAADAADTAVVAALVPVCVANAKADPDNKAKIESLVKVNESGPYGLSSEMQKDGWGEQNGLSTSDSNLLRKCAEQILALQKKA